MIRIPINSIENKVFDAWFITVGTELAEQREQITTLYMKDFVSVSDYLPVIIGQQWLFEVS